MAAQEHGAGLPMDGDVVGPAAPVPGPIKANAALPADPNNANIPNVAARLTAPVVTPPVGQNIANIVAPVVAPLAGPNIAANLGAVIVPPGGGFDIPGGLLGSPLRKSNLGCEIHAWIDE